MAKGDRVSVRSSGGGGWGDQLECDLQLVERDVRLSYVSTEKAKDVYGVVIGEGGTTDSKATSALRAQRRADD